MIRWLICAAALLTVCVAVSARAQQAPDLSTPKNAALAMIKGVEEADMAVGKISIASPVALALLRARIGDEVAVHTPRGTEMVEILAIRYPDIMPQTP